ncbi:ABC transporter permease [Desulfobotulus sp.]|jgi:NitT/TauT family transport system permease protein|uniref:ABC transporter permease n=1 Tax=Desulfobotulus sp. TaxID=1940337 RepID=UPI002A369B55|nr:ABC transporter permease [Desulfobotulus sp.]MDY0163805.1 ABC transporter permease [Desulfobotulus sp.]
MHSDGAMVIKKKSFPTFPGEGVILPLLLFLALLAVWHFVARNYGNPYLMPGPERVWQAFLEIWREGKLGTHIRASLFRMMTAYLMAVAMAIPLGLLLGWYGRMHRVLDPFIQLVRPISPVAWFPLAVLWFNIGDLPAIFIIFIASFFPILLSTVAAVHGVSPLYLKVASNFGSSHMETLCKVVLPAAFPRIVVGLHIALGVGWIHVVAGEMLGAQSGLGYLIIDARNFLRTDKVMVGMGLVGCLGLILDRLIAWVERKMKARWGGGEA